MILDTSAGDSFRQQMILVAIRQFFFSSLELLAVVYIWRVHSRRGASSTPIKLLHNCAVPHSFRRGGRIAIVSVHITFELLILTCFKPTGLTNRTRFG